MNPFPISRSHSRSVNTPSSICPAVTITEGSPLWNIYNGLRFFWGRNDEHENTASQPYTTGTAISDVINDPAFGDYGRLIFPVDTGYMSGSTLGDLRLTWYSNIDPEQSKCHVRGGHSYGISRL